MRNDPKGPMGTDDSQDTRPLRRGPRAEQANYGPHKLDPVKGAVAGAINARVTSTAMREVIESDPELDLSSVEIQIISPTEWQFRVKTNRQGTRYFALKLREMM